MMKAIFEYINNNEKEIEIDFSGERVVLKNHKFSDLPIIDEYNLINYLIEKFVEDKDLLSIILMDRYHVGEVDFDDSPPQLDYNDESCCSISVKKESNFFKVTIERYLVDYYSLYFDTPKEYREKSYEYSEDPFKIEELNYTFDSVNSMINLEGKPKVSFYSEEYWNEQYKWAPPKSNFI